MWCNIAEEITDTRVQCDIRSGEWGAHGNLGFGFTCICSIYLLTYPIDGYVDCQNTVYNKQHMQTNTI